LWEQLAEYFISSQNNAFSTEPNELNGLFHSLAESLSKDHRVLAAEQTDIVTSYLDLIGSPYLTQLFWVQITPTELFLSWQKRLKRIQRL
jgi:hypothetical protein